MPVGRLRNIANEFMSLACEFIVTEIFQRNARRDDGLIQTLWSIMEDGITFGYSTVTLFFTKIGDTYTVDFKKHYWADVFPVPGTSNINTSDVFIREWWTPDDVKTMMELGKEDESINTEVLKDMLDREPTSRDTSDQSEVNRLASVNNLGVKVYKYYVREDGKYMLYVFAPMCSDFIQKRELPCRGHVTFYYSPDYQTCYGRSILALIGGIQYDIDSLMRSKRRATELEVDPMLIVKGRPLSEIKVAPRTMIEMPTQGDISAFELNTPSLQNYIQEHSANQALIYQLAGYPEAATNSGVTADTAIGKTPTALKMSQANLDYADNQVSHNLKLFLEQLWTQALKFYFAALPDRFLIELSEEYATKIAAVAPDRFVAPGVVVVDNDLDFYDYEIDIESGKDTANQQKLDSVSTVLQIIGGNEMLFQRVAQLGILDDIIKEVVFASGLQNDSIMRKLAYMNSQNMMNLPMQQPVSMAPAEQEQGQVM